MLPMLAWPFMLKRKGKCGGHNRVGFISIGIRKTFRIFEIKFSFKLFESCSILSKELAEFFRNQSNL